MHVSIPHVCLLPVKVRRGSLNPYKWFWASVWALGIDSGYSGKATCSLHCWALKSLCLCFSLSLCLSLSLSLSPILFFFFKAVSHSVFRLIFSLQSPSLSFQAVIPDLILGPSAGDGFSPTGYSLCFSNLSVLDRKVASFLFGLYTIFHSTLEAF
jgi:hypothetical protein